MTYGKEGQKTNLAMTPVANEKAAALLPLWKLVYADEKSKMANKLLASVRPGATPGGDHMGIGPMTLLPTSPHH